MPRPLLDFFLWLSRLAYRFFPNLLLLWLIDTVVLLSLVGLSDTRLSAKLSEETRPSLGITESIRGNIGTDRQRESLRQAIAQLGDTLPEEKAMILRVYCEPMPPLQDENKTAPLPPSRPPHQPLLFQWLELHQPEWSGEALKIYNKVTDWLVSEVTLPIAPKGDALCVEKNSENIQP